VTDAIVVRRVRLPLSAETARYWFDGDPFLTHFMNALSSTFPDGEAFFVRSVQHYRDRARGEEQREAIRRFAQQEGLHSREHDAHLALLEAQGYRWLLRLNETAARQMRWMNRHLPLYSLATTAALEHLTAVLARQILAFPERWADPMSPDMKPLWRWHAVEEAEHKAVAFDVLEDVSGSWALRAFAGVTATLGLAFDTTVRLAYLLARDGLVWRPSVWWRGLRRLAAPGPARRQLLRDYFAWYRRGFHPAQIDDRPLIEAAASELREAGFVAA
jgi:predicted metal-dependent hydrolase